MFARFVRLIAALSLCALPIIATSAHAADSGTVTVGSITVSAVWARATPAKNGGVFLTLRNDGDAPDRLVGVSTDVAQMSHLHVSEKENGVEKMRMVDGIDIPAHTSVTLKPGGYHVMLMGLTKPLKAGESFPLTLTLQKAGQVSVTVTVKAAGAMSGGGSMDHMDMDKMDHGSNQ